MSLEAALAFVGSVRRDETLRARVEALDDAVTEEDLVHVGGAAGYDFTAEELQRAHALDWRMRWARYAARPVLESLGRAT
jgi:predicted ribosomally synthesized peptide with nif11-like leader